MSKLFVALVCGVALTVVAVGLWAFEPWRLLTHSEVDEPLPGGDVSAAETRAAPDAGRRTTSPAAPPAAPGPAPGPAPSPAATPEIVELARGEFVAAEHATSGVARVIELRDGRRFVRLEGLDSSDGPDLHVWVTDQPSGGDWGSYDDGRSVALGELTATRGNQNYAIPSDVDLGGLTSVVIWCDRFDVAFGTAPVRL